MLWGGEAARSLYRASHWTAPPPPQSTGSQMFKLVQLRGPMTCSNLFNMKLVQSESGQLTSYWNAFLFVICTLDPTKKVWNKRAPGCIEHLSLQQNH